MSNAVVDKRSWSHGRVAVIGKYEYFQRGGDIVKATLDDDVMPDGYRHGRFECVASQWNYRSAFLRNVLDERRQI